MSPVSPYPALAAMALALGTLFLLRPGKIPVAGRFESIDGLRGYLAFFVFLHHSAIWFFYLKNGQWRAPPSRLYGHFGSSSVVLFFMITGFLFWSKLMDHRSKPMDWTRLYVSRVLRLTPAYLFAIAALLLVVAFLSGFTLQEPLHVLLKKTVKWAGFTVLGTPDLNGVRNTAVIIAQVTWSLPCEWLFYSLLPLFALFFGIVAPWPFLLLGAAALSLELVFRNPDPLYLVSFAGGILAAFAVRWKFLLSMAAGKAGTFILIGSITATIYLFPIADNPLSNISLSVAFLMIACGNNLFGLLTHSLSRALGQISYSIYVLHGILLFVVLRFVIGFDRAASLSPFQYWLVILACSPVLILLCSATFRLIEAPAMKALEKTKNGTASRRPV